jgi:hypothetical protein
MRSRSLWWLANTNEQRRPAGGDAGYARSR